MKFKKIVFALFFLTMVINTNAKTIDFDATRNSGEAVDTAINRIMNTIAADNDIILFNSTSYDLAGKGFTISKEVTLQGITPSSINRNIRGADDAAIATLFINATTIRLYSNNIKLKNIAIIESYNTSKYSVLIDLIHPSYTNDTADKNQWFTGIDFNNVRLSGGGYQVRTGNGIGATFTNVSFVSFKVIGLWFNRVGKVDSHPKVLWDHCLFSPRNDLATGTDFNGGTIEFNDRAISFDAGNEEYPVVWNHNYSKIDNCLIVNTGFGASSRGRAVIFSNNIFDDNVGGVDLIHIEEYSSDFTIENNQFKCNNASSKVIVLDRELQVVKDVRILNNTITGKYQFFISAYAPNNITITGNDFTNASGSACMNFTYYENFDIEPIPAPFLSDNIIIKDNIGLDNNAVGFLRLNLKTGSAFNTITDFPTGSRRQLNYINNPPALIQDGIYEIVNKSTGNKLSHSSSLDNVLITSNNITDLSKWRVVFTPPFTYTIQNMATNNFLETNRGYTESEIFSTPLAPESLIPYANNDYASKAEKPFWCMFKKDNDYVIYAGGNERQSALSTSNTGVKLVYGKKSNGSGGRILTEYTDLNKWSFNLISAIDFIRWDNKAQSNLNLGQTYQQQVSYSVNPLNTLQFVQYGLVIVNITNNSIVSVVTPQVYPQVTNTSNGTLTFNFTIPTNIALSSNLPAGQKYFIRARFAAKEGNVGNDIYTIEQTEVTIDATLGLSNQILDQRNTSLKVYPNPVINTLYISNPSEDISTYDIFSTTGKLIKNVTGKEGIDVSFLAKGIYILKNKERGMIKFIKN